MRKPVLCHMRTTKAQISLRIAPSDIKAHLLFADEIVEYMYLLNPVFKNSGHSLSKSGQTGLSLTWSQSPQGQGFS